MVVWKRQNKHEVYDNEVRKCTVDVLRSYKLPRFGNRVHAYIMDHAADGITTC